MRHHVNKKKASTLGALAYILKKPLFIMPICKASSHLAAGYQKWIGNRLQSKAENSGLCAGGRKIGRERTADLTHCLLMLLMSNSRIFFAPIQAAPYPFPGHMIETLTFARQSKPVQQLCGDVCLGPRPGGVANLIVHDLQDFLLACPLEHFGDKAVAVTTIDPRSSQN